LTRPGQVNPLSCIINQELGISPSQLYQQHVIAPLGINTSSQEYQVGVFSGIFFTSIIPVGAAGDAVTATRGATAPEAVPALGDTSNLLPGYRSFSAAKRALGSPGAGNVFDHTVEQSQIARSGFTPEEINSPYNLNPVPAALNQAKADYYASFRPFTGGVRVRVWLGGQSFADQYEFSMDILMRLRNGQPLP
jgi:hypothetical protein